MASFHEGIKLHNATQQFQTPTHHKGAENNSLRFRSIKTPPFLQTLL
jgi:hypothetical protein